MRLQVCPADVEYDSLANGQSPNEWVEDDQAPNSWATYSNKDNSLRRLRSNEHFSIQLKGNCPSFSMKGRPTPTVLLPDWWRNSHGMCVDLPSRIEVTATWAMRSKSSERP